MSDTPAAKDLTETFLNIIRQQRHLGVRIVISTQEPTISPRLIDLCSMTIVHRFTSPEWYRTIRRHITIGNKGNSSSSEENLDGLCQIASLRTGEALIFAPSAYLLDGDGSVINAAHGAFKMVIRKRVTWDGGRTILCVR
jgi:DNA helicase HerA-like ATPase